jgi:hypothetical protein
MPRTYEEEEADIQKLYFIPKALESLFGFKLRPYTMFRINVCWREQMAAEIVPRMESIIKPSLLSRKLFWFEL